MPLFFTLSGFVLAYGYANRLKTKNEIFIFYLQRFCRIAPLFYVVFLFWGLLCCLSTAWYAFLYEANTGTYAYMNFLTHLPFFLAGLGCYYCWKKNNFSPHKSGWFFLLGAFVLIWILYSGAGNGVFSKIETFFSQRYFWVFIFGTLILHACFVSNQVLEWGLLCWLGKLSFGIYLLHPIVITGLARIYWIEWFIRSPLIIFIIIAAGTLAVVVFLAHLSLKFIEEPGIKIGKRLCDRFFAKNAGKISPKICDTTRVFDKQLRESS